MPIRLPLVLRLTRRALDRRDVFGATILRATNPSASEAAFAVHSFAFKNDEHGFARALLARRTEVWLYRANQRAFCGDFLIVDMSSPSRSRRRAFVLELKHGMPLRRGAGGVQLRNAARAVRSVVGAHLAPDGDPPFEVLTGDGNEMLKLLSTAGLRWPEALD